jgi:hypothetical protein
MSINARAYRHARLLMASLAGARHVPDQQDPMARSRWGLDSIIKYRCWSCGPGTRRDRLSAVEGRHSQTASVGVRVKGRVSSDRDLVALDRIPLRRFSV